MGDTANFIDLVLGNRKGYLAVAFGRRPYFDDNGNGKYTFPKLPNTFYEWPGEMGKLANDVGAELASGEPVDIYVCPYVRFNRQRRKGDALPPMVCHVDLDDAPKDQALYDTLNPLQVASGQPGHVHAYVPLSEHVPLVQHRILQEALRDRLGGDDKIADNDLLRLPGTLNWKPATTPNTGEPAKVEILPGEPTVWKPVDLADLLGLDLSGANSEGQRSVSDQTPEGEPVDFHNLPDWLKKRFHEAIAQPGDRSETFHGLVGACRDARLTEGQTVTVMWTWKPGVDKYGDRVPDMVALSWKKVRGPSKVTVEGEPVPVDPEADLANGRLLAQRYGDQLRYVVPWKKWLVWDGARWKPDETGEATRCAKAVSDTLPKHATKNTPARPQTSAGISAMLTMASTEPGIALSQDQLDADPYLLNVTNGTVDLRTGELRPHDRDDLLTKVCGAAYTPQAQAPGFVRFLERVQPDQDMRDFLARLFGHALLGKVVEHVLPVFYGIGANGKTTLVEAIAATLGDYADTVEPGLLIDRGEVHPTGTADLFKLRLAVTHETDEGRRLAEGTVKRLTGGDRVKARRMREDFWTFDPSHSIVMHTNHKPIVRGDDEGIWRRLRLVPFAVVIPEAERDGKLPERLTTEIDGILAWIVAGYRQWQDRGLADPQAVADATKSFRGESDLIALFLDERCMSNSYATIQSSELFGAWVDWCKRENVDAGSQTAFTGKLIDRGFDPPTKSHGRRIWHGIGLYADEEPE